MDSHRRRLLRARRSIERRRGFTLTGMLLAVALCGLALGLVVAIREAVSIRNHISKAVFSADGSELALFRGDGGVAVFNSQSGKQTGQFHSVVPGEGANPTFDMTIESMSPDLTRLARCRWGPNVVEPVNVIEIWTGREIRSAKRISIVANARAMEFSPDGEQVAFLTYGSLGLSILDVDSRQMKLHLPTVLSAWANVFALAYMPNGRQIVVAGYKRKQLAVAIVDVETGAATELLPLGLAGGGPTALGVSPDGRNIVLMAQTGGQPDSMHVWDGDQFQRLRIANIGVQLTVNVDFSPDSSTAILGGYPATAIDLESLTPSATWRLPEDCIAVAPALRLAAARAENSLQLYDISTGEPTGGRIRYSTAPRQMLFIAVGFGVWMFCFLAHLYWRGPRVVT